MKKIIIFGNSSSGKSTMAKNMARTSNIEHLDLDTIAWENTTPPVRMTLGKSLTVIETFINSHSNWVIEGCYADLLELILPHANEMIFLDLPVQSCVENAQNRPWEPHKYRTKQEQDANLEMLIDWIKAYQQRDDVFSQQAHQRLYEKFSGAKVRYTGRPG
ncbi:shikimate kinase [Thalassotalea aquiviva]|uniref:shikimate kinase n=1 Tax=Thalassotalea aquiviva TaxID=3242415 RepID=UPI00352ACFAF